MDTQDNHRGSVSSSKSLDIPVTPSRSPKKVSFSDELPGSQVQSEPSGVSQVLQQASQYLERLHGERDFPVEDVEPPPAVLQLDTQSLQLEANTSTSASASASAAAATSAVAASPSILIGDDGNDYANGKQEVPYDQPQSNLYMERYKLHLDKNCSSMELEARREKQRWLLISECSARFGEGKHTREAFRKLFLDEVRFIHSCINYSYRRRQIYIRYIM